MIMRTSIGLVVGLSVSVLASCCSAGQKEVAVIVSASAGADAGKQVAAYLQYNGRVAVHLVDAKKLESDVVAKAADVTKLVGENDAFVIALVSDPKGKPADAVKILDNVAVVNIGALQQENAGDKASVTLTRRINKESCRALGLLAGLTDCPNPTCCLFKQSSVAELDMKGGNFCPPCLTEQFEKKMAAKGVKPVPQEHEKK